MPFSELRQAYKTVRHFIEEESLATINSLDCKLENDLGIFGDDTGDLISNFIKQFELKHEGFEFDNHFHSEGELNYLSVLLPNLIISLINLIKKVIDFAFKNQVNTGYQLELLNPGRMVTDLTFRQLLTWYIEKDYRAIDQVCYKLAR